jgi:hypothetical protein
MIELNYKNLYSLITFLGLSGLIAFILMFFKFDFNYTIRFLIPLAFILSYFLMNIIFRDAIVKSFVPLNKNKFLITCFSLLILILNFYVFFVVEEKHYQVFNPIFSSALSTTIHFCLIGGLVPLYEELLFKKVLLNTFYFKNNSYYYFYGFLLTTIFTLLHNSQPYIFIMIGITYFLYFVYKNIFITIFIHGISNIILFLYMNRRFLDGYWF